MQEKGRIRIMQRSNDKNSGERENDKNAGERKNYCRRKRDAGEREECRKMWRTRRMQGRMPENVEIQDNGENMEQ